MCVSVFCIHIRSWPLIQCWKTSHSSCEVLSTHRHKQKSMPVTVRKLLQAHWGDNPTRFSLLYDNVTLLNSHLKITLDSFNFLSHLKPPKTVSQFKGINIGKIYHWILFMVKESRRICVVTVWSPLCSWGFFSPSGSLGLRSPPWQRAPPPAPVDLAVPELAALSPCVDLSTPGQPGSADPVGFGGRVLSAVASAPWSGGQSRPGSPSAGWRWGASRAWWSLGRRQHHVATPHHRCTGPGPAGGPLADWLHPGAWKEKVVGTKKKSLHILTYPELAIIIQTLWLCIY